MRGTIDLGVRVMLPLLGAVLGVVGCYSSSQEAVGGDSHFLRPCTRVAQCKDLGDEYACVAGHCQASADASTPSNGASSTMNAKNAMTATAAPTGGPMTGATPLVMFLIDTSASMERTSDCACSTAGCKECLPRCADGERNRWAQMLETLTGTYDDFTCEALDRTEENGSTYDIGFSMPYHRPSGTQRDDGMFDTYRDRLRFGLATFDGFDTFVGAAPLVPANEFDFARSGGIDGLWSYSPFRSIPSLGNVPPPSGDFYYPGCDRNYFMDTGIRNASAEEGALLVATDPTRAAEVDDEIQASLLRARPYGGTPIAAALDDLYYFLNQDPKMAVERAQTAPKHVVLITDGMPDTDYRDFGCNCALEMSQADPTPCGAGPDNDPTKMHCPYPAPEQAARTLRCGQDPERCDETGVLLHVVGFSITSDKRIQTALDAIAMAGGDEAAHFADSEVELRGALEEVLANIAH